jgi:glycerol uptake facilitator-like aquaporin
MSTSARHPQPLPLRRAIDEFVLTTALMFLVVTVVRWLRDPASALYIGDLRTALAVIGPLSGAVLVGLILSPPGRRSGGHMNPAVTIALWLMDVFPGAAVLPYAFAQLAGSVVGTALGRLVWGPVVSGPTVGFTAIRPGLQPSAPVRHRLGGDAVHRRAGTAERRVGQPGPPARPGAVRRSDRVTQTGSAVQREGRRR